MLCSIILNFDYKQIHSSRAYIMLEKCFPKVKNHIEETEALSLEIKFFSRHFRNICLQYLKVLRHHNRIKVWKKNEHGINVLHEIQSSLKTILKKLRNMKLICAE